MDRPIVVISSKDEWLWRVYNPVPKRLLAEYSNILQMIILLANVSNRFRKIYYLIEAGIWKYNIQSRKKIFMGNK